MSEQGPTVFSGRYELLRHIARGGMADVYLARDETLGREVALKVLFPEFANDPNFVERFRREAQAAATLNHPNVVGIYDWGQERGTYYIVMEHVSGRSMSDVLRSTGPLHPDRAAEIGSDVAAALALAHGAGLVHRDIKLGNILVSDSGDVKVADFGIATALVTGGEAALTQHGSVMGTATYFSPEQAQGKSLDGRSDLYSLGVVMYEMLAGVPPFQAETPVAVAYKHVQERPQSLSERGVQVPQSLEAITMKLLAKNPSNRYPTADDLRSDLHRYLQGAHNLPGKAGGAAGAGAASATATEGVGSQPLSVPVEATTAQPVTPAPGVAEPLQQAIPMRQVHPGYAADPQQGYSSGSYYYQEPAPGGGMWRMAALVGSLLALVAILGYLLSAFIGELGGDGDGPADETDTVAELIEVPDIVGMDVQNAREALLNANLSFDVRFESNNEVPTNEVFGQDPPSGQRVEAGEVIELIVSSGTADTVPNVIGETEVSATSILQGLGYVVSTVTSTSPQESGTVINQSPASGAALAPGQTVELTVSTGPEVVPMIDVEGLSVIDAVNALRSAGFEVGSGQIEEASEEIEEGKVIRTEPVSGSLVPAGTQVMLVVSTGLPTVAVPAVTQVFADTAIQSLRNSLLEPIVQYEQVPAGSANVGRVIAQEPEAFVEVEVGSEVLITVGEAAPETTTTTTVVTPSTAPPEG